MKLVLRPRAIQDLEDIVEYIAQDSADAARRVATAVVQTCEGLLANPKAHAIYDLPGVAERGIRKVTVDGFRDYLVFYIAHDDAVEVLRVLHGRRNLGAMLEL